MAKTKVISVANQKGGVGKSTSVYCIGAGLTLNGKKVLLIHADLDGYQWRSVRVQHFQFRPECERFQVRECTDDQFRRSVQRFGTHHSDPK